MATASTQPNILVKASARNLHLAPRKMRLVTNLLKGMRATDAVVQLQFVNKKGAPIVKKLLESALANAENNFSQKREDMVIQTITCDMGAAMKRFFPRARGSAFVIRHKLSHVNVTLVAKPTGKKGVTLPKKAKAAKAPATNAGTTGVPETVVTEPVMGEVHNTAPLEHGENLSDTVKAKSGHDEHNA
jgi:large subunit ribosomal protein L22